MFVPGTLPGEQVRVRVVDDRKNWARAELIEVLQAARDRVEPPCPYVPACGGCDLQHIAPDAQRRLKTRVVREQLARIGGVADAPVADCRAVGDDLGYRTHAQLHAGDDCRLGFLRASSHDVVAVDVCKVLTDGAQQLREEVGDSTGAARVAVRAHTSTGTAAVVLTPGPGPLELPGGDFALLLEQPDGSTASMRGDGVLAERAGGFTFRFDASTFFQVSPDTADALIDTVLEAVGPTSGALTWDLYAGVGLLSVPLAAAGAEVTAVEGHDSAADWARQNATAAGLEITVVSDDVATFLASAPDPPDIVVLDPPRSGARSEVIERIVAAAPARIVYVACDVAALARDTRLLTAGGFRLVGATPLDLFPMTHHVEVVATFTR